MKTTLFIGLAFTLIAVLASGCDGQPSVVDEGSPPGPDQPISSDETPAPGGNAPDQPAADEYTHGMAEVSSLEVLTLESFPVQIHAVARGSFRDGCTEIDQVMQERSGNAFHIKIVIRRPAHPSEAQCTESLVPFEETVPLEVYGLTAGDYTVEVNGMIATFTLYSDNTLPTDQAPIQPSSPPGAGEPQQPGYQYGLAAVERVTVRANGTASGKPEVTIYGYLPDGCTTVGRVSDRLEGNTVLVTVETRRPSDMLCIQVIKEFQVTHVLTSVPGRGDYIVDVHGVGVQLSVP